MDRASRKQGWMGLEGCVAIWVEGASSRQRAVGTKGIWKWSGVAADEQGRPGTQDRCVGTVAGDRLERASMSDQTD